jgi:hypothetical protein
MRHQVGLALAYGLAVGLGEAFARPGDEAVTVRNERDAFGGEGLD